MKLDWDKTKRDETLAERSLDFVDVAFLDWKRALTIKYLRQPYPEKRFITFGEIKGRLCVIAWCERDDALRVISMRKANAREVKKYGWCQTIYR